MKGDELLQAGMRAGASTDGAHSAELAAVSPDVMATFLKRQGEDAARIRELERVRDELTQMIVKDMKTPLTGLADMLELADRASGSPFQAETSQFLNEALGATETLEELVDLLLDVRRMMAGTLQLSRTRCDVFLLAGNVAGLLGEAAHAKGITLEVKGESAFASCDVQMVSRVVRHLLRNAINSNPKEANVVISVSRAGAYVRVAISGHGDGDASFPGAGFEQRALAGDGKPASGLGFTFFRLAVDAHHGMFGTEVEPGARMTRWFSLPADDSGGGDGGAVSGTETHPLAARSRRYLGGHRVEPVPGEETVSLVSRDTRYQLAVAVTLLSSIPLLAFAYVLNGVLRTNVINLRVVYLMMPAVVLLVGLGIVLLQNHTREVARLRNYLALMAKGDMPKISFEGVSADFAAMERDLGEVVKQTGEKVRIIESQSKELLQSEQQRVMIETVGAACHHLGQPATVIAGYLDLMRRKESSPELQGMIAECQAAAADVHNVLHRLQDVARYQTEPYLLRRSKGGNRPDERIVKT